MKWRKPYWGPTGRSESRVGWFLWVRMVHPEVPRGPEGRSPAVIGSDAPQEHLWRAGRVIWGGFRGNGVPYVTAGEGEAVIRRR